LNPADPRAHQHPNVIRVFFGHIQARIFKRLFAAVQPHLGHPVRPAILTPSHEGFKIEIFDGCAKGHLEAKFLKRWDILCARNTVRGVVPGFVR
jgi:hypothetical protein